MVGKDEVMPLLLAACPSFEPGWVAHSGNPGYEGLLYVDLVVFGGHLVELMRRGVTAEFPAVFAVIEQLHTKGDSYVREAATLALLEGIRKHAAQAGVDPKAFVQFLHPKTARWWGELDAFAQSREGATPGLKN